MRCTRDRARPRQRASRPPTSGDGAPGTATPKRLRRGVEARARAATGSAGTRPRPNGARSSKRGSRPARTAIALEPDRPRRALLARRQHGRAGRVVRPAPGPQVPRPTSRRSSRPSCGSIRRSCRDRPIARWDAGTSRCRGCSAAATRKSEEHLRAVAHLQPEQHRPRISSCRDADRDEAASRSAERSCEQLIDAPLDPDVGARRSGVQGESVLPGITE